MRTIVLVIFSAIGLAGLFVLYWTLQPATPAATIAGTISTKVPRAPKRNEPSIVSVRAGKDAWLKQYDSHGIVTSEFRGEQYHPKPNGTVDVVNPTGRFFLANHQRMEIHGKTGNVVLKNVLDPAATGFTGGVPPAAPSQGRLEDVTVTLIDEMREKGKQVALVMRTNNVYFENETALIFTQSYRDEQGRQIERDQVPVHVTGDIDMEGRGLKARWNDRDGRLEEFEIAHGDVLIIKDPSHFSLSGEPKKPKTKSPVARSAFSRGLQAMRVEDMAWRPRLNAFPGLSEQNQSGLPLPFMLAANDNQSAGEVITSFKRPATQPRTPTARENSGPSIYRARFFDNVRINQPDLSGKFDQLLITNVNEMDVDFLMKQSTGDAATRPSPTEPTTAPAPALPAGGAAPVQPANPAASAAAATQPVQTEQPIYIHWTGMLRMTPLQSEPTVPLKSGESAVKLVGLPVNVHRVEPRQQGTEDIKCAAVVYATAGERAWLYYSNRFPQVLIDKSPAATAKDQAVTHLVSAGIVEYSRADRHAIVNGAGRGEIPLESTDQSQHPLMHAAWLNRAEFGFTSGSDDQLVLRSGRLEGQVDVEHPRLNLRSQVLDLSFNSPPTKPAAAAGAKDAPKKQESQSVLRQVIATTDVYCQMIGADGKSQIIESNRLLLDTDFSDGKLYARHVNATDHVHAYADDDLQADNLDVLLKPAKPSPTTRLASAATRKSDDDPAQVELEEMVAWGNVTTKSKDGSVAIGDKLTVTANNGKQHAILTSAAQAKVMNSNFDFVTGPEIQFDSGDGRAYVIGPGALHAIKQASTTQPAEPMDVAWATGAQFDGAANRIDADGSITVKTVKSDGFVDTATGDHIRIDLQKKPLEAPAEPTVAAAQQSKTKKTDADTTGVNMDLFKDKQLVAFTLIGNADIESTLKAADASIAQQMVLEGPKVIVRQIDPDGTPTRTVNVPVPGRMLVRDHRKTTAAQAGDASANGATFFDWTRSLVYSEANHRADMVGQVHIRHKDDDPQQIPVEVNGEHVIAFFDPPAPRPARPAAKSSPKPTSQEDSRVQLNHVRVLAGAGDTVVVNHGPATMTALQVDYDPKRHVLVATGTPRNPVFFYSGTSITKADKVEWDTITWSPSFTHPIMNYQPATPGVQTPKPKPPPTEWEQRQNNRKNQ